MEHFLSRIAGETSVDYDKRCQKVEQKYPLAKRIPALQGNYLVLDYDEETKTGRIVAYISERQRHGK